MTAFPLHVIFQTTRLRVRSFAGRYHGETSNDASGHTTTGCLLKWRRNKLPKCVMCKTTIYICTDVILLTYLFTYLLTYSLTHLLIVFTYLITNLLTHLFTYLLTYSLTYLFTYSLTNSLTHLLIYLLIHSLTRSINY
jgi:hypothetical protein